MYDFYAILVSILIAFFTTWFHLRVITAIPKNWTISLVTLVVLIAHMIEIQVYAWSYNLLSHFPGFGCIANGLSGECVNTWFDLTYYSAAVYTTLGFGDLIPVGPMRILTGIEAVIGLALIAWSATFTFLRYSDERQIRMNGIATNQGLESSAIPPVANQETSSTPDQSAADRTD